MMSIVGLEKDFVLGKDIDGFRTREGKEEKRTFKKGESIFTLYLYDKGIVIRPSKDKDDANAYVVDEGVLRESIDSKKLP